MPVWSMRAGDGEDDDVADWMARRNAEVANLNDPEADTAGRDAWNAATRDGTNVAAQTPLDLRSLGAVRLACGPSPAADGVWQQVRAGARGVEDAALLGHGSDVNAALGSIPALISGDPVEPRYQALVQQGRDQDRFDATHYPIARDIGETAGTVGSLILTDGLAAAAVPRIAESAYSGARAIPALTTIGRARLAAGGAGVGVAGQAFSDVLSGHTSNWRDYLSSGLSGATTALTAPRIGAVYAGGVGGGTRYLADTTLNGVRPQVDRMGRDILTGGYLASVGRVAGEGDSNALNMTAKGKVGEDLTRARLRLDGEGIIDEQRNVKLRQGRSTRPDFTLKPDPYTENRSGRTENLGRPRVPRVRSD